MPTGLYHCAGCEHMLDLAGVGAAVHRQIEADCPPELLAEAQRLAAWLQDLAQRYAERLRIRLLDPQSPRGLGRALRHGIRRYPAFIINGRRSHVGWEAAPLEQALEQEMASGHPCRGPRRLSWDRARPWLRRMARAAGEIFYGMTVFDWVRELRRERGEIEHLFVLITFGDLVGLPVLPPYYTLRLLPYAIPCIQGWKRCLLRERDLTDLAGLIEGID